MSSGNLDIVTDGMIFQVDSANKLCGNVTTTNSTVDPTDVGTFVSLTVIDGIYDFDGVDDYIDFGDIIGDQMLGDYTVQVWVKLESTANNLFSILMKRDATYNDTTTPIFLGIENRLPAINRLGWVIGDNGTGLGLDTTTNSAYDNFITANEWTQITLTIEGVNGSIYKNGTLFNTETYSGTRVNNAATLELGRYDQYGLFWNGKMSSCKIYNTALTASEISKNYESQKHKFE